MKRSRLRLAFATVAATAFALCGWQIWRAHAGDPRPGLDAKWHEGHRVLDRHGALLSDLPSVAGVRGTAIPLDEIGDKLVLSTLASEDKRFFGHGGVDPGALVRAVGQNVRHRRVISGASTITQQLVKLLDAGGGEVGARTLAVKAREAARAQNLETRASKREILEAYLNRLPYGRGLVGPAAAARAYFGVHPRDLSWAQAAVLAVLPRAPSYLDLYRNPDRAVLRQRALLSALREDGVIEEADYERAVAEPIVPQPIAWSHDASYLVDALRQGHHGGLAQGSLTRTTLDGDLQRDVEGLIDTHLERLAERHATSAAVVVIDNASGEVLVYVGGRGKRDEAHGGIDMARARRQPGSALKPFAYAMAFERGMSPTEMLADVPARFGDRAGEWAPVNFDGTFWGPMSAREALAGSLNVPAVRIATDIGESAFLDRLHRLGFASLDRAAGHYGLALVLGAGEVTLTELAASYATIARGGEGLALRFRAGTDGLGAVQHGPTVIEAAAAAAIADALSDPQARIRGLGSVGPFDIGYPVAVKTGTSSGYRDAWAAGFTHERTVAVWVGNPDGRATVDLTGALGAGPLFSDVMKRAMRDVGTRAPLWQDALLTTVRVCPLSGKRVGDACPHGVNRRVPAAVAASTATCELHRRASRTTGPIGWRCDASGSATIVTLPEAFTAWLASQPVGAPGRDVQGLPWLPMAAVPDCSSSQTSASLRIEDPPAGAVLLAGHEGTASVEVAASWIGAKTGAEVEIALDGKAIARLREPFRGHFDVARGDHRLVIRPVDPNVAVRTAVVDFSVR